MVLTRGRLAIVAVSASLLCFSSAVARQKTAAPRSNERQWALQALNRLTFGPRPGDVDRVQAIGVDKWIDLQLHPESINDDALDTRLQPFRTLRMSTRELVEISLPRR